MVFDIYSPGNNTSQYYGRMTSEKIQILHILPPWDYRKRIRIYLVIYFQGRVADLRRKRY